jgi:hypothetical protein
MPHFGFQAVILNQGIEAKIENVAVLCKRPVQAFNCTISGLSIGARPQGACFGDSYLALLPLKLEGNLHPRRYLSVQLIKRGTAG